MQIDVIEVLYMWLNRGPYYGEVGEVESAIGDSLRKTSTGLLDERYGDVYYEGTEDRSIAWLDIELALNRLSGADQRELAQYLTDNRNKSLEKWTVPSFGLWLRIYAILTILLGGEDGTQESQH
jgi:hypothetical protein